MTVKYVCVNGCGDIKSEDMIPANTAKDKKYYDDDESLVCPHCSCDIWYIIKEA
jgi:hypothetical protein